MNIDSIESPSREACLDLLDILPASPRMDRSTSLPSPSIQTRVTARVTDPPIIQAQHNYYDDDVSSHINATVRTTGHVVTHGFTTSGTVRHRKVASTGRGVHSITPLAPVRERKEKDSARSASADRPIRKPAPTLPLESNLPRHRDRFVPLPGNWQQILEETEDLHQATDDESEGGALPLVSTGDMVFPTRKNTGSITVYCIAESFSRKLVTEELKRHPESEIKNFPQSIYVNTSLSASPDKRGDVFILDYGVVICWNLSPDQEKDLIKRLLSNCVEKQMPADEISTDHLSFHYSAHEPPNIQNDIITINKRQSSDHEVKLAISHALAQSSKLSVYEERIGQLVEEVRTLPEEMAKYGEVRTLSRQYIVQLMGKVFIQKSAVNLLSSVLDTPEYFWRAPDNQQVLYGKVCEYLELQERVDLVNARFEIIQKMLKIWSEHSHTNNLHRLDAFVIFLIVIETIMAAFQVVGMIRQHIQRHASGH